MNVKHLVYTETEQRCAYCGSDTHLTVDHIYGRDHKHWKKYDNLIVLCRECHDNKDHHQIIAVEEILNLKRGLIFETLGDARLLLIQCIEMGKLKSRRDDVSILLLLRLIRDTGATRSGKRAYVPTREGKRFYDMWIKA